MMGWIEIVGFCAAAASVASFFPQAWKIIKSRETENLSAPMYVLTSIGFALWLIFGVARGEWALILPNALCLAATLFILLMILAPARTTAALAEKLDPET
jgi:MtN3 and saliva related transmembrane protein